MKTKLLLTILLSFYFCLLSSQVPQGLNYQALAGDASGNPIRNTELQVKISILSDTTLPVTVWEELHSSVRTNAYGVFSLVVGKGTRQPSSAVPKFSDISWKTSQLFIKTQVYYQSAWKTMGSAKLWSVPYSMVADNLSGAVGKLSIAGTTASMDEALFEVKNKKGQTVFAVYNEGVRVYVDDGAKSPKGGFAIGGFDNEKGVPVNYFIISPDSARIYINNASSSKTPKGGFAIGGFDNEKGSKTRDLLTVSDDSIRMYIDNNTKTPKGGFAIGGFDNEKGINKHFLDVSTDATGIVNPSQNRILWYPIKNAFLAGKVLIENPDSVGVNSFATGYESKAKGQFSQALGYKAIARGDYATAIGKGAEAIRINSFAFGENAHANKEESYAFGRGAIADGFRSFAFGSAGIDSVGQITGVAYAKGFGSFALGMGSQALGDQSFAIGIADTAKGSNSFALGQKTSATGWGATSMGMQTKASGSFSTSMGYKTIASNWVDMAIGNGTIASGGGSFAGGSGCIATGDNSLSYGLFNLASGSKSVAMGYRTAATSWHSFAMGDSSQSKGDNSVALGFRSIAIGNSAMAVGSETVASGGYSIAGGFGCIATGGSSVALGSKVIASGGVSFAFGGNTVASGDFSIALGADSKASGNRSVAIGNFSKASEWVSIAMGDSTVASGGVSIALGSKTLAEGYVAMATGYKTIASGQYSFAGGYKSKAISNQSFAFGSYNLASGNSSVAIGENTKATNFTSFAMGNLSRANASASASIGWDTRANSFASVVLGRYNDTTLMTNKNWFESTDPAFVIGNGDSHTNRRNAFTVLQNSNVGINMVNPHQKLDIAGGNGRVESGYNWLTSSDIRFKNNISTLESSLDKVLNMRGVRFDIIGAEASEGLLGKNIGFIAQELETVVPELVVTGPDGYKSVAYDKITAVLTEAIKEQQKQIETVNQENSVLKSELEELKILVKNLMAKQNTQTDNLP